MKTTPIYGIPYIEADDLVSAAPDQFQATAEGVEKALIEVDARATPEGVRPVIATTKTALSSLTGITGQTGYVTADPDPTLNGPYVWTGTAWLSLATADTIATLLSPVRVATHAVFSGLPIYATRVAGVTTLQIAGGNVLTKADSPTTIGRLDEGYRPSTVVRTLFGVNDGAWGLLTVELNGNIQVTHRFGAESVTWSQVDVSTVFC